MCLLSYLLNCKSNLVSDIYMNRNDILRRRKYYVSDWTDAFKKKRQVIPAVLFLYFACLAPAVSFGTISSEITNGSMGVVEFLLGSGVAGMVGSLLMTDAIQVLCIPMSTDPLHFSSQTALLNLMWTTNGICGTHGSYISIHIGFIPILYIERLAFLPSLCVGRLMDEWIHDIPWIIRLE